MAPLALILALTAAICAAADVPTLTAAPTATPTKDPALSDDGARVAVLGYHDFSETEKETAMRMHTSKFRKQMTDLRQRGITVISLDDFLAWKRGEKSIPDKSVLITLDDGWKSVYSDAFPILKELGYPFTLFLYKNYIDGGKKALTSEMITEMLANGATLGSHSVSHPYPLTIRAHLKKGTPNFDAFIRNEFVESKHFLESRFSSKVTTYAYPGGFVTDEMLPLAGEAGYHALFTVLPGKIKRSTPDMRLPRYMILGNQEKIFDIASSFLGSQISSSPIANNMADLAQTTPYPVTPAAGSVISSRLPLITAQLASLTDLDSKSLVMKVSGFGDVPAKFDTSSQILTWQVTRRLRQPSCQVSVAWKDASGKPTENPLRWTFLIDREAAYLPDN